MDSTLTYIASKTTGGKGSTSKAVTPEDVHYRKLNKELMEQSMTLVALTMEREERSKTIEDEAGDDAFELYLAAIETLVHALPCKYFFSPFHFVWRDCKKEPTHIHCLFVCLFVCFLSL
jgi:hypothetical protein